MGATAVDALARAAAGADFVAVVVRTLVAACDVAAVLGTVTVQVTVVALLGVTGVEDGERVEAKSDGLRQFGIRVEGGQDGVLAAWLSGATMSASGCQLSLDGDDSFVAEKIQEVCVRVGRLQSGDETNLVGLGGWC